MADSLGDQSSGGLRCPQVGRDGMADARATFLGQFFSLRAGTPITEGHLSASSGEHTHRGSADATRTAGNESDATGKGKRNGHGRLVSSFWSSVARAGVAKGGVT